MKITLPGALFLIFLTLKLAHVIDWSWLWIAAPLWALLVLLAVAGVLLAVAGALTGLDALVQAIRAKLRARRPN